MKKISKLTFCIVFCESIGLLSTPFTLAAIPVWYALLHKPFFTPPDWIFGPVWTVLYALMGIAWYLVWTQQKKKQLVPHALRFFFIQLCLNFLWSFLFFGLRSAILGLIDIVLLVIMLSLTIREFAKVSKLAAYLLIPYLLWVSFASLLNLAIVFLNWTFFKFIHL